MKDQLAEWVELGMVDKKFKPDVILEKNLLEEPANIQYQYLPLDTKYFKDLELDILALFDDLDSSLDGWLIHSENYQALNTLLPKFQERVKAIYIDPPFNLDKDADFLYSVAYEDATWLSILQDRIALGKIFLNKSGSMFARCDSNGNMLLRLLLNSIFSKDNYRNELVVKRSRETAGSHGKLEETTETILYYSKTQEHRPSNEKTFRPVSNIQWTGFLMGGERKPRERIFFGKSLTPPDGQHYPLSQEKIDKLLSEFFIRLRCTNCGAKYYYSASDYAFQKQLRNKKHRFKFYDVKPDASVYGVSSLKNCNDCKEDAFVVDYLGAPEMKINSDWTDIESYAKNWAFSTENSEQLLKRIIAISTDAPNQLVLDFFLGSGSTIATAHKMGHKWLGIELGEQFNSVIIPRMKMVLQGEKTGVSKDVKWKGGGFFKYFDLENYEDALRNALYENAPLFAGSQDAYTSYVFLRDLKMLDAVKVDKKKNKVEVSLEKLYLGIDLAETLSCLTGKWIKRITKDTVEFQDGTSANLREPDWSDVKPLIWW
jgi:adenine specific DNA methylase Mod